MAKPRKPDHLKIVTGTFRQNPKKPKIRRLAKCPSAPRSLSKLAKAEWRVHAPLAHEIGTLTPFDVGPFCLLCEALADIKLARKRLEIEGDTVITATGGVKTNPARHDLNRAWGFATHAFKDFGLSPKGRESLTLTEPDDPPSPNDRFFDD